MAHARIVGGAQATGRTVRRVRLAPADRQPHGDYTSAIVLLDGSLLAIDTYVVDFTLRWMHDEGAAMLLLVSPAHEPGLASCRLANKHGIVLATVSDAVLELADDLREIVEASTRVISRLYVDAVERLGRVSPGQGVVGSLQALDGTLESSSRLVGFEGDVLVGPPLDDALDPKDRVSAQVTRHDGTRSRLVQPVTLASGEQPSFWLVVERESPTPMWQSAARTVVKLASSYVATRLISDRLEQERDARVRLGMLNAIVALADRPSASLVQQLGTLGWKTDGWCTAIHLRVGGAADALRVLSLTAELQSILSAAGFDGPLVERSDGWTTWMVSSSEPQPSSFHDVGLAMRRSLQKFVQGRAGLRVYAGIGRPHMGISGLKKGLAEAQEAATIAQAGGTPTSVQHIDELGVQRILFGWYTSDEFGDFARTLVRPVTDIDRDEELMRTLEVFLDNESSPTLTADALGLHRNTVINRISHIRRVLAVDFDDPDQRLAVQLACRVVNLRA